MSEASFKISQDYEVITPKKKSAYPILVEEWEHLKSKIRLISDDANLYHTIGSILLGIAGSSMLAALTLEIPSQVEGQIARTILISWFIFIAALISGLLSLYFAHKQRSIQKASSEEIIKNMEIIEQRYKET